MKTLNEEKSISIFDCAWNKDTRVLDSSLPINYCIMPPQTIEVIGKNENVVFHCERSDGRLCRTIYTSSTHSILLYVPWWDEQRNMIVT